MLFVLIEGLQVSIFKVALINFMKLSIYVRVNQLVFIDDSFMSV